MRGRAALRGAGARRSGACELQAQHMPPDLGAAGLLDHALGVLLRHLDEGEALGLANEILRAEQGGTPT